MSKGKNTIVKNFIYNSSYQLLLICIPLILTPYLSRVIGANGMGTYSYVFTVSDYFALFAMLGIKNHGSRVIAKARDNKKNLSKAFWSIYYIQIITTSIVIIAYILYVIFFCEKSYKIYAFIEVLYLLSVAIDFTWFFAGLEDFKNIVVKNTVVKLATIVLIIFLVRDIEDLYKYIFIMSAGYLLGNLSLIRKVTESVYFIRVDIEDLKSNVKPILVLFISVLAISLYKSMDKIMIKQLGNITQLGYYEYADKISYIQVCLTTAFGTVMLPRMANLSNNIEIDKVKEIVRIAMTGVMCLSIGISLGIIAISDDFVPLYLGQKYECVSNIVKLLVISGIFVSWANVIRTLYLIPFGKDKVYVKSVLIGAILNVVLNAVLIPFIGAKGAAIATIGAEASVAIYQTICVRNIVCIKKIISDMLGLIIAGEIMYVCVIALADIVPNRIVNILIQVISGFFVYGLIIVVLLFLFRKDWAKKICKKYKNSKQNKLFKKVK